MLWKSGIRCYFATSYQALSSLFVRLCDFVVEKFRTKVRSGFYLTNQFSESIVFLPILFFCGSISWVFCSGKNSCWWGVEWINNLFAVACSLPIVLIPQVQEGCESGESGQDEGYPCEPGCPTHSVVPKVPVEEGLAQGTRNTHQDKLDDEDEQETVAGTELAAPSSTPTQF